ncbi:MAG TPA: vitamin K epoxide reductase family protein [Planctomycetaceae bacterium]|mgnify:CR=1 FL=1|nr:vitamin K epoxide reductase family protein [Planctomycetaceae bacterium]
MTSTNSTPHANGKAAGQYALNLNAIYRWFFRDMKSLPAWPVTLVLATCISVAIGTSSYLLWADLTSSPIAGCGSGGGWLDCENVASSRWSLWLGLPVSLLALGIYLAMATALVVGTVDRFGRSARKVGWAVVTAAVFAAAMSAIWFIAIQLIVLQHICLYCMLAHTCGLVATATILLAGPMRAKSMLATAALSFAGFTVLAVGQMLTNPPDTYRIETFDGPTAGEPQQFEFAPPAEEDQNDESLDDDMFQAPQADSRDPSATDRHDTGQYVVDAAALAESLRGSLTGGRSSARRSLIRQVFLSVPGTLTTSLFQADSAETKPACRRVAAIQGGTIKLDVARWPHLGPSDARYVFVELFDYCCPPCRETYKTILGAQEQLGGQLAVVLLPVPLNSDCNPTVQMTNPMYKESCELSKLAVAVWRVDSTQFPSLHNWMLQGDQSPSYAEAKAKAVTLVDQGKLDAELASGVPDQFIARHIELYKRVGQGTIPKLMFPRTSVVGKFSSVDGLVDLIRREGS